MPSSCRSRVRPPSMWSSECSGAAGALAPCPTAASCWDGVGEGWAPAYPVLPAPECSSPCFASGPGQPGAHPAAGRPLWVLAKQAVVVGSARGCWAQQKAIDTAVSPLRLRSIWDRASSLHPKKAASSPRAVIGDILEAHPSPCQQAQQDVTPSPWLTEGLGFCEDKEEAR